MDNEKLAQVKNHLKSEFDIEFGENLNLGNICNHVFKAKQGNNSVVVKLGISEAEKSEIFKNKEGYVEMEKIGAENLIPTPLNIFDIDDIPVIVMHDCGLDFWHAVKTVENPFLLYRQLVEGLRPIYERTKFPERARSIISLKNVRDRLISQYEKYLLPVFGNCIEIITALENYDFGQLSSECVCFSSFDFTPEDVFVTDLGVKFVDPLPGLVGIPIIDMACFAGVARDAYELPGSKSGYDLIKNFAIEDIPKIIKLDIKTAKLIFLLGRSLQCALSARFRIGKENGKAFHFFSQSQYYCKAFLNSKTQEV